MAKNTQEAEVIVTMNGEAAKRTVSELTNEYQRLQKEALEAYKAGNDALGKKLDTQAQKLMKDVEITRRETKKFADVMKDINGASLKELRSAAKQLQSEISKLTPGTQQFIEKSKQLKDVNTRIRQLTNEFKGLVVEEKQATLSLKSLADGFNKYFGMVTAGIAAITGLSMAFRKSAQDAAQLDDTYSDVMKTTGLLHEEVADLDKELMKINTRTSREQLLLLARDAGKLGIQGKEDILGFVRAADQIQVALGEDLGEGAIRNLGKIADVLGYTQSMGIEKSLLSIASSINAVGQASTASESYLVEFTQRMAGVAAQTGISAANIIGFASGLDQSAMKVEMASTAFQKFLMKLYEDPAKFAAYANLEVGKFTDLLKNDANAAVLTILKALKDQDGFAALVPIFKDMGLDGARAVSVLAAMATNIDAVTEAQALANVEFDKATSVTEEYNTKNNNMQAQLEKARKEFQNASIALGQSLNPIMLKSTKATTYLIKALAEYGKEIKTTLAVIAALTALVKAQAIAEGVKAAALKVSNTLQATGTVLSNKMMAAYYRLTGQTMKLAAAQQAANAAMSASVFGVIAVTVATLTFAISRYVNKQKEANKELEYTQSLEKKIADAQATEISQVTALTKIVEDQNMSYFKRKQALDELKKIVPDYHASLTTEGKLINNNKEALDNYIANLKAATRMKILEDDFTQLQEKMMAAEEAQKEAEEEYNKYLGQMAPWNGLQRAAWEGAQANAMKTYKETSQRVTELKEEEKKLLGLINATSSPGSNTGGGDGGDSGGGGRVGNSLPDGDARKAFDARIKEIDEQQRKEENALKRSLMNNEITQAEYNARMNLLVMQGLQQRIDAAKQYGQDETKYVSQLLDEEIKLVGDGQEQIAELMGNITSQSGITDPQANEDFWNEIYKKRDEIVASLQENSLKTEYDTEMQWIEKLHQRGLLAEEEYEKAKLKTKLKYFEEYSKKANDISEKASSLVSALQDAELAKAEANYQAQLTAAGDNAEQREQIEANYEQKKLDIQKKYADVDMGINIAKTIAAGALAAIQSFADLGPVAGAVAAAMIAVTTAAQVASIIQQRNAIKNMTISGGGGGASVPNTGQRTITGFSEGGFTPKAASDHTAVGLVHANEYVAPAWMVRQNPVTFANLERYRRAGSHGRSGSASRGFAEGGFTGPGIGASHGSASAQTDLEAAIEAAIAKSMANGAIRAYLVRKDLTELDNQDARFKAQTSR